MPAELHLIGWSETALPTTVSGHGPLPRESV